MDLQTIIAILVFVVTYTVIAIGKLPGYRIDRAGIALLGASLLVAFNVLSPEDVYKAINFDTITLLLGMMIVVANMRVSGFFRVVNAAILKRFRRPITLLFAVVVASGVLSAFLVNDTICLVMTPLVLDLVLKMRRNPMPYLLAIAMASNIGSVATITGNPQNMIIGSLSGISYSAFAWQLAPIGLIGLLVVFVLLALLYRDEFLTLETLPQYLPNVRSHKPLIIKTSLVTLAMVVLFFTGQPVAKVAIIGGSFLLLTRRVNPSRIYKEIDWPLLVMFIGLFVVVAGLEKTVIGPDVINRVMALNLASIPVLSTVTAVLGNLISNVPAVLVMRPFIEALSEPDKAWLVVAMASTLAGNFTLVGSVANLIVAQKAQSYGVTLSFWTYFKVGAPLTILTILIGIFWLM
ncbi:anion transporter [Microvirga sp. W0021]|uniref:Anion transporter n=1 Tax=Hohaiivirga grylli TaxID=3133970 RepID=A0ABV0BIW5_9HYPH